MKTMTTDIKGIKLMDQTDAAKSLVAFGKALFICKYVPCAMKVRGKIGYCDESVVLVRACVDRIIAEFNSEDKDALLHAAICDQVQVQGNALAAGIATGATADRVVTL